MNLKDFQYSLRELMEGEGKLMFAKNKEYTQGSEDVFKNFKELARDLDMDPLQIWAIYFLKHIASIKSFIKDRKVYSEPIQGRIMDCRNYLAILYGMLVEMDMERELENLKNKDMDMAVHEVMAGAQRENE